VLTELAVQLDAAKKQGVLIVEILRVLSPRRRRVIEAVLAEPEKPMRVLAKELAIAPSALAHHQAMTAALIRARLDENPKKWMDERTRAEHRELRRATDQVLVDVGRAVREVFPDRADELMRELDRRLL